MSSFETIFDSIECLNIEDFNNNFGVFGVPGGGGGAGSAHDNRIVQYSTSNTSSTLSSNYAIPSPSFDYEANFTIIREVLSLLNGFHVEQVKKNPAELLQFFRSRNEPLFHQLDDVACQMIIRIGGLGKILLKMINYLNYYNSSKNETTPLAYPIFDEGQEDNTLGNIRQYFVNSIYNEIKDYNYNLLMIESKFRSTKYYYPCALRRILIWSTQWLDKFLFLSDLLKSCLDINGVRLLNNIYDRSRTGDPMERQVARSILHQVLKPFIFIMFDWLLYGEIKNNIDQDFFICTRQGTDLEMNIARSSKWDTNDDGGGGGHGDDLYDWKHYQLNTLILPKFMRRTQVKKIYLIGNAIRLLRNMIKEDYNQSMLYEIFNNSNIQANYQLIKKFMYNNIESYSEADQFFFEHSLVDDFDQLLDSYYEVINKEMFVILKLDEFEQQFTSVLAYVLMQRGDFYESLFDYLLPLFRKPASEVINFHQDSGSNLSKMFSMFMVNSKLFEMNRIYKIDSLLYNLLDLNQNLTITFNKKVLQHQLGWDIFLVRYQFSKRIYRALIDSKTGRYEKLFRQMFHYKRVLFNIRKAQQNVMHYRFMLRHRSAKLNKDEDVTTKINQMLNILHFIFFHMFGFTLKIYQHIGNQISSAWSNGFAVEFQRKQTNIEKFIRKHDQFINKVESIVFFGDDPKLNAVYASLNDSILEFSELFCESDLFPFLAAIIEAGDPMEMEALFRLQFKISINISKYRCCVVNFVELSQITNLDFKFDILNYQPCLDKVFHICHDLSLQN